MNDRRLRLAVGYPASARATPSDIYAGIFLSVLFELEAFVASVITIREGGIPITLGATRVLVPPPLSLAGVVAATITWAFWTRRDWSRHAAMTTWLVILAAAGWPTNVDEAGRMISCVLAAALVAWYLYRSASVHEWFHRGMHEAMKARPLSMWCVVIIVLVYLGAAGFLGVLLANVLDDDIANRVMHIAEPLSTCVLVGWILLHPTRGRGRRFTPHIGDDA